MVRSPQSAVHCLYWPIVIQVKKINNFIKNLQKKIRKHLGYQQQHKLFSLGSVKPAIGQEWFVAVSKQTAVNTIVERQDKMPGDKARARVRLSCDEIAFSGVFRVKFYPSSNYSSIINGPVIDL